MSKNDKTQRREDKPDRQADQEEHTRAAGGEAHISTPSASATVKMSLSPRPHMFMQIR